MTDASPAKPGAFTFQPEHDGSLPLETAVFQALGAASVCWDSMDGTGVFQSDRAKEIGDTLVAYVKEHAHSWTDRPLLGLATTGDLLGELISRFQTDRLTHDHEVTVDPDPNWSCCARDLRHETQRLREILGGLDVRQLAYRTVDS